MTELRLYKERVQQLFAELRHYYWANISASESKYKLQVEAAVIATNAKHHYAARTPDEGSGSDGSAAVQMGKYQTATEAIRQRVVQAKRDINITFERELKLYDVFVNDHASDNAEAIHNFQFYLSEICSDASKEIWLQVAVNDHDMAGIVRAAGLKVPHYLDVTIPIAATNAHDRLNEQMMRAELKDLWDKFNGSPVAQGASFTDDEHKHLHDYGGVWVLCTVDSEASNELRQNIDMAYLKILFKWQLNRRNAPGKRAALKESGELMIQQMNDARQHQTFDQCMRIRCKGARKAFHNAAQFLNIFAESLNGIIRIARMRAEKVLHAILLLHYVLSSE